MDSMSNNATPPRLLSIPRELREQIFSYLLHPSHIVQSTTDGIRHLRTFDLRLLLTCSQIYAEALSIFHRQNTFVRIFTPFADVEQWVSIHGAVPLVRIKGVAADFKLHHLNCKVDSPRFARIIPSVNSSFVVLLEDLEAFTQHWFYTEVTNPGQNGHLTLTLEIKNPHAAAHDEDTVPKKMQRLLLAPFGRIKGLHEFVVNGNHLQSIEKEVRAEQAVPNRTAKVCLEETTKLKDLGNIAFREKKWNEALQLYMDAFAAMYIICQGRQRTVWGDASFQTMVSGGQYDGESAQQVRIVLRVTLVANVVAVYLQMKEYEEARFWGMRTIELITQSMGGDQVMHGFPGAEGIGKIYFRTGMACIELGDKSEARRLLRMAAAYRPADAIVSKALASVALQLG